MFEENEYTGSHILHKILILNKNITRILKYFIISIFEMYDFENHLRHFFFIAR